MATSSGAAHMQAWIAGSDFPWGCSRAFSTIALGWMPQEFMSWKEYEEHTSDCDWSSSHERCSCNSRMWFKSANIVICIKYITALNSWGVQIECSLYVQECRVLSHPCYPLFAEWGSFHRFLSKSNGHDWMHAPGLNEGLCSFLHSQWNQFWIQANQLLSMGHKLNQHWTLQYWTNF